LQLDFAPADNNINHSMIVTEIEDVPGIPYEVYLTYHTTNTLNKKLSTIISQYPDSLYYAHRT
jgi:hypothetical protein